MKNGNWIPISKAFMQHLPRNRAYSKVEAAFSIQCDYDASNPVTVAGYADLWQWSRKKVRTFFEALGVSLEYPECTLKKQNQKGQIRVQIRDRNGTDKGQIRLIESRGLQVESNRRGTEEGQKGNRKGNTTRDPNPNPDPNPTNNIPYGAIIDHLNRAANRSFKHTTELTRRNIKARWGEGFRLEEFITAIDNKVTQWKNDRKYSKYLRPKTLFGPNFESYVQDTPHPLDGQVSDVTKTNIDSLKQWSPPQ